jgi:hypothetical protein
VGLGDITGVFSRYFVVGFFLPAFASLIALWVCATSKFQPEILKEHNQATQLLILGGVALIAGLALSGLSYPITRAFEGYPLMGLRRWPVLWVLPWAAIWLQQRSYDRLQRVRDNPAALAEDRAHAAWHLDQSFPPARDKLLPTRLGNAIRAFESYSNSRWNLDGVTIWPRIDALIGSDEREIHVDAKIDLYVFINASIGAFLVGICLGVDKAVNDPSPATRWPLYLIPFLVSYILYRTALTPAVNWGLAVRSSIDIHRLELYALLGVRRPTSFSDERALAQRINQALLYGTPLLGDDLWRLPEPAD